MGSLVVVLELGVAAGVLCSGWAEFLTLTAQGGGGRVAGVPGGGALLAGGVLQAGGALCVGGDWVTVLKGPTGTLLVVVRITQGRLCWVWVLVGEQRVQGMVEVLP